MNGSVRVRLLLPCLQQAQGGAIGTRIDGSSEIDAANSAVRLLPQGGLMRREIDDEALFEPVYGRMLLAGERSGSMESVLQRLAPLLEENCGHLVDRLVGIVDPLLSGVLMVTVGFSLISVMLPLIGMMNSVG